MSSNVIIISGIGQSRATGIYRERNGRPTLNMQNLPLGSYTVYLFSIQHGRRTVVSELPFDGRYLSADQPLPDSACLVAIAERGRIVAYGASEGVLPSAGELEAQLEERRRAEELQRAPAKLLRGEPQFFREDEKLEVVSEQPDEQPDELPDGAYAGVTPEDFLLQTITDPLMKEDLTALETERLLTQANAGQPSEPSVRDQVNAAVPRAEEENSGAVFSGEAASAAGSAYMQERSERILGGKEPDRRGEYTRGSGRTVILQENQPIFRSESGSPTYYETIRREAEQLLRDYEHERFLESFIEESSFVRIPFDEAGHYYVFGVVSEDGQPKYICFAVPEPYRETPPETLRGFTQFVPRDPLRPYGDGYFMMFQSAVSGRTIPARD